MKNNTQDIGLILGSSNSAEVQLISKEVSRRAYLPLVIDSSKLLKTYTLDYYPSTQNMCIEINSTCLLYTSPSPRDRTRSRMPSSA